jgi:hypothetical protein
MYCRNNIYGQYERLNYYKRFTMIRNIFYDLCVLMVTLAISGCMSYNDMQLKLANDQNGIPSDAIGSFSFSDPRYNNSFQLVRGEGDTDNSLFEIRRGRELIIKSGVTPTAKQYSVRIAMGASSTAGGMQKIFTFVLPVGDMPGAILAQQQLSEPPRPAAPLPPPAEGAQYTWTVNNLSSWIEAVNGVRNGGNNSAHFISVSGTVSIPSSTENTFGAVTGITVNIEGNGILSPSANGSLLYIGGGQTIIAKDIVLRGRDANSASVVYIGEGGSFSLGGNARLTGNTTERHPNLYGINDTRTAGVYIDTNAKFTLSDNATIYNNTSAASAGGVYINSGRTTTGGDRIPGGTFIMEGGTITGNTSFSASSSATTYPGGGVYIRGGTFTMLGGTIWGNLSWGGGGGVYVSTGDFIMQGGTITDNIAENNDRYFRPSVDGGGVYIANGGFTMRGGTISGNTATGRGGGVFAGGYRERGGSIMQGGTISGNTAPIGGGLYVAGAFTMQGGEVSGNNADSAGGGVAASGAFTMQGGSVSGNTTKGNGGGIFLPSDSMGAFIMQGSSTVAGNTAGDKGGGVYLGGSATFSKTGGNIYGNDATQNLRNSAASAVGHAIFENKNGAWRNSTAGPSMTSDSYGFWLSEG